MILQLAGFSAHLESRFGASIASHRLHLRQALFDHIRTHMIATNDNANESVLQSLTDLSKPPRLSGWAISTSHCPVAGGFVATPISQPLCLGFDVEVASRLKPDVIARIAPGSTEKSIVAFIATSHERALFWAAKEAAIKAFGHYDTHVQPHLGNVEITKFDPSNLRYEASRGDVIADGFLSSPFVISGENLVAAIASITSTRSQNETNNS